MLFVNADLDKWDLKPIQMTISTVFTQVNGSPQHLGGWAYKVFQRVSICFNHFMTPALSRSCYLHRAKGYESQTFCIHNRSLSKLQKAQVPIKKKSYPGCLWIFHPHWRPLCGQSPQSVPALPLYHAAELTSILEMIQLAGGKNSPRFQAFPRTLNVLPGKVGTLRTHRIETFREHGQKVPSESFQRKEIS